MDKIGIVEINKIAFSKLRKQEVSSFYNDVMIVVNQYDAEAMHIGDTHKLLLSLQPKTKLLQLTDRDLGKHALTPEIEKLHEKRLKFAAIITNLMRNLEKADLEENVQLVELGKPFIYQNLNYLRQRNNTEIEVYIDQFFNQLEKNSEAKDALYELGFEAYLNELEVANNQYKALHLQRNKDISKRHKGSTKPLQRELLHALKILLEQVDYYQHIYKDVDYAGLNNGLNYVIGLYTKLIKTRDTQRRNKKLKAEEDKQAALEEQRKIELIAKRDESVSDEASEDNKVDNNESISKIKPKSKTNEGTKGKDKRINGLLDILRKPDKGKKNGDQ